MILFDLVFFGVFIYVIVRAVKNATNKMNNGNWQNTPPYQNNVPNQNYKPQGQPDRYSTINSHYSQATLKGNSNYSNSNQKNGRTVTKPKQSPLAGQFVADNAANSHNHAYEHKVEPIDEASVHELSEDRKEAYRERKAQMKADLPKTSYSQTEQKIKSSNGGQYRNVHRNSAKNGDNGYMPNRSEKAVKCSYCGANNIIPWNANVKYSCYFCREEL